MPHSMKDLLGDAPYELPKPPHAQAFGGASYEPTRDYRRMVGHIGRVWSLMLDGKWRTLGEISQETGGTVASVSARLRDFRKTIYGSHHVDRKYLSSGLFVYRVRMNKPFVTFS